MRTTILRLAGIFIFGALAGLVAADSEGGIEAFGSRNFAQSCAMCHGADAKGGGIMAQSLLQQPPDLTVLSKNNAGRFPFSRVYESIDGRYMPSAHGSRAMPVWGRLWGGAASRAYAETYLRGRILEVIIYLRSIQEH